MFENRKEPNKKSDRRISRADVCLAAFSLLLAMGIFGWSVLSREDGQTLRISCDGQIVEEVSLAQIRQHDLAKAGGGSATETVRYCLLLYANGRAFCEWCEESPNLSAAVPAGSSYNLLVVDEERVWMQAADCPDQICVHHIPIMGSGESIICLPHKLVVEIMSEPVNEEETLDGMTKAESTDNAARAERRCAYEADG